MTTTNNDDKETVTLAVFGASGRTGRHVVECALEKGWTVKALVRNPSKFQLQHDQLTVIEGDFSNTEAIKQTVRGAMYVISCAGGPNSARLYDKGFMERFVREQLWPALRDGKPKAFLFQAGALSKIHKFPTFGQLFMAPLLGLGPMAKDNDAVMRFVNENPLPETKVVVTRPGALIDGKGGSPLRTSCWPATLPITFCDLGKFNVEAVADEGFTEKYPYITLKYGF